MVLLLCSDGLYGGLEDETLGDILGSGVDVALAAQRLLDAALERGGTDNITAVLLRRAA